MIRVFDDPGAGKRVELSGDMVSLIAEARLAVEGIVDAVVMERTARGIVPEVEQLRGFVRAAVCDDMVIEFDQAAVQVAGDD